MKFYKIIKDNKIIDCNYLFFKYQMKNNLILSCDLQEANFLQSSDGTKLYHPKWLAPVPDGFNNYEIIDAEIISKEEYDEILQDLELGLEKDYIEYIPELEDLSNITNDTIVIDEAILISYKQERIKTMSQQCKRAIINGFDITLSDNNNHHFSLEITDQLKIDKLYTKAKNGEIILPYHADNEEFKFYSYEDIVTIHSKMEYIIDYNTVYFNSLKSYIQSLNSVEEINSIYYGIEIPEEYQSEVLKTFK